MEPVDEYYFAEQVMEGRVGDSAEWDLLTATLRALTVRKEVHNVAQRKKRAAETRKRQGRFEHLHKKGSAQARCFDPTESTWWKMIKHPDMLEEGSRQARRFRRKFRLPFKMVETLQRRMLVDHPEWADRPSGPGNGGGQKSHPLIMKILATLRFLATGDTFESIEDAAHIAAATLETWVPRIMHWMEDKLYPEMVYLPDGEELDSALEVFELLGFPGAYCSSDGVHIPWDACPAKYFAKFKGKELYPTIAFNVSVLHSGKIIHVADWCSGATNDMTQARYDELFAKLHAGTLHPSRTFELYRRDGVSVQHTGLYAIVDNGYHRWVCLMPPFKHALDPDEQLWAKRLESVRKNVECVFGILKKRFAILKRPFLNRKVEDIQTVFRCCCTLNNMLMEHDGRDTIGQLDGDWVAAHEQLRRLDLDKQRASGQDWNQPTVRAPAYREIGQYQAGFNERRDALVQHMAYMRSRNALRWPKSAAEVRPRPTDVGNEDEDEDDDNISLHNFDDDETLAGDDEEEEEQDDEEDD